MSNAGVARRYAEAAFEISVEQQALDRWRADIGVIAEYFGNHQLTFILGEPNVRLERKEQIVRDLLADKLQPEALSFALVLTERSLVGLATRIRDAFELLYNDYKGQIPATVTTAVPLDDATRQRIVSDLQTQVGKRILLDERVDPSILGGAIVRVGDTLMDGSVRQRLAVLRTQIAQGAFSGPDDGLDGYSDLFVLPQGPGGSPAAPTGGSDGSDGSDGSKGPSGSSGGSNGDKSAGPASGPSSSTSMARRPSDAPRAQPVARPQLATAKATNGGNSGGGNSTSKKKRKR